MRYLLAVVLLLTQAVAMASTPVRVAVAANFANPLRELVKLYEKDHPDASVQLTVASTGKLAAQIRQGAPFDMFLAADARRPKQLSQENLIVKGSRRTYALGRLALWSPDPNLDLGPKLLEEGRVSPLALANAKTAPYGAAAAAVLARIKLPSSVKLVRGENVAQAWTFAKTGAARAAFVALSQVQGNGGSLWLPPTDRYPPIIQQSVLLETRPEAKAFYDFLFSDAARAVIKHDGYGLPEP